jgi:hypothetical protein
MEVRKSTTAQGMRIGGASIAWITLYGALCGVTALIPIFPYVGGGGYVPLQNMFSAIAPILLGPVGGIVSATVGGIIGMFIAPGAFPLQLVDVILTGTLPAMVVALMVNAHQRWGLAVAWTILVGIIGTLFPFYVPGASAGFAQPPNAVVYFLLVAYYWAIPLIVLLTPLGRRLIPEWARSEDRQRKYIGLLLAFLLGLFTWFLPWSLPYWYVYEYTPAAGVATLIGYMWWVPLFAVVIAIIAVPLVEALRRSGLPKIPGALW